MAVDVPAQRGLGPGCIRYLPAGSRHGDVAGGAADRGRGNRGGLRGSPATRISLALVIAFDQAPRGLYVADGQ